MLKEVKYDIVKFVDEELELEVNVSPDEETIWLTQEEIAQLFGKARNTITEHINIIYKSNELVEELTCRKNRRVRYEGNRKIEREIKTYNLDLIILVGYRVNSKKAQIFRKWANKVLKEYLLKGYVINENRVIVSNDNYIELRNEVASINSKLLSSNIKTFNNQYGGLIVLYTTKVHDRYIIIDQKKLYHIGHSIKDLGKKIFSISESDSNLIKELLSNI